MNPDAAIAGALIRSRDTDTGVRLDAIVELGEYAHLPEVRSRLIELIDDEIINVEVAAAEALVRHDGTEGLFGVLENPGRRGDDGGDSDYIANRLNALDASGAVPVSEIVYEVDDSELSENQKPAIQDLRILRGDI